MTAKDRRIARKILKLPAPPPMTAEQETHAMIHGKPAYIVPLRVYLKEAARAPRPPKRHGRRGER